MNNHFWINIIFLLLILIVLILILIKLPDDSFDCLNNPIKYYQNLKNVSCSCFK